MKKRYVIPSTQLSARPPFIWTIIIVYMLRDFEAPEWLCGIVGTIMALVWIAWALVWWNEEEKPIPGYSKDDAE